jgi:regulation of enolase protein 1 (concanavalin A-like superfamily)
MHARIHSNLALGLPLFAVAGLVALVGIGVTAVGATAATTTTIYASPSGTGTACSTSTPCSITEAQAVVDGMAPSMSGNIVVQLAGGLYRLSSSLAFTGSDSATNGYSITWEAASGQTPVLSGGEQVTGWTEVNTAENIWAATLPSGVSTRDLWVNGAHATLASGGTLPSGTTQTSTGYTVPGDALQELSDTADLEFMFKPGNWVQDVCGVASISGTTSSTTVTMDEPCFQTATAWKWGPAGLPSSIINEEAYIDGPGQWAFNSATHTIYYSPTAGQVMTSVDAEVGDLTTLVALNGTEASPVTGISFSGVTFENTTWPQVSGTTGYAEAQADLEFSSESCAADWSSASFVTPTGGASINGLPYGSCAETMPSAVEVHAGRNLTFSGDDFTQLGTAGITLDGGSQSDSVTGNAFTDVGGNGIQIGSVSTPNQSDANLIDSSDTVEDNFINHAADEYQGGVGIWAGYTKNLSIEHNDIENAAYTGISLGWGWGSQDTLPSIDDDNQVIDNFIDTDKLDRQDGGAIYSLGPQPGGAMSGNYIENDTAVQGALYLDQGSTGWTISNNVENNVTSNAFFNDPNSFDPCNTVTVTDTYTTSSSITDGCADVSDTTVVSGGDWPAAATSIMASAGLQSAYAGLTGASVSAPYSTYASTTASFTESNGVFGIDADGADAWGAGGENYDDYGAIYAPGGSTSSSTTTVEVDSQQDTSAWAKAGIMLRDSISGSSTSLGYAVLAVTPGEGITLQWDGSSSGKLNELDSVAAGTTAPIWLRLIRSGTGITGEYSTNDSTWTTVGTATLTGSDTTEDVGMFSVSHDAGILGQATFSSFSTSSSPYATYASTSADLTQSTSGFTIDAAGADAWGAGGESYDQYGAIYVPSGGTSSSTTTVEVNSQQNTNVWAKAGIMLRNSIAGSPTALGYAVLAVTPGEGITLQWDDDSSGLLNQLDTVAATTTAPIWLRLIRSGTSITGEYSTNDSTWTTVGTATLTGSDATEDVGMFSVSHDPGVVGQATFSSFSS